MARPGQAHEASVSENRTLVRLVWYEWHGSGAVPQRSVEICGSVEETHLHPPIQYELAIFQRSKDYCFSLRSGEPASQYGQILINLVLADVDAVVIPLYLFILYEFIEDVLA